MRPSFLLAAAFLAATAAGQETQTLTNPEVGMALEYPKTWQVKKEKYATELTIPIEGVAEPAILEIYSAVYRGEPNLWEELQAQVNKQMSREVLRQWREEIMGVPLLMTKVGYEEAGKRRVALTGLVYSATPRKLHFRLVAPSDGYDSAEQQLRQVLQSLRTVDGKLPETEDPSRKIDPKELAKPVATKPPKVTVLSEPTRTRKIVKGPVATPLTAGGKNVELRVPEGWTAEKREDGSLALRHPDLSGEVRAVVASVLDSDLPRTALIKLSSVSLGEFTAVSKRQEPPERVNRAGASVLLIRRIGTGPKGPLTTCESVGSTGEFYWMFAYRREGNPPAKELRVLDALLDGASVEPAPAP